MSPWLAFTSAAVVALLGLAGVALTAYAGLRANRLRLDAEAERDEATAEALRRQNEADTLRVERRQIAEDRAQFIRELLAENARLRGLLASREDRP